MNKKFKKVMIGVATAASMFLAACGSGGAAADQSEGNTTAEGEPIRIGSLWELTGYGAAYGNSQAQAVQMAVEEINEAGGVLGQDIEVVEYDTRTDDAEAAKIATRLATEDNVVAMIGPSYTGGFQSAIPVANQQQVPYIGSSVTVNNVTLDESGEVYPYVYRTATPNSVQAAGLTKYASDELGAEKAIILADNSTDYGKGWTEEFEKHFDGEIVAVENFTTDQTDFQATLTKIQGMDYDVLFIPGYYEQLGPIVKQAREMGIDAPIVGSNGFGNSIIYDLAGPENMTGIYYPTEFFVEGDAPETVAFRDKYTEKFDVAPDMFAGMAYDTVYIIAEAIERAGAADSVAVNEELAKTENFEGLTGTISFDESHEPVKATSIVEIQDGAPAAVHAVETNN